MWNGFTIGGGNSSSSAVKVHEIEGEHGISQNSNSYWVSNLILNLSGTIYKNTTEGMRLMKMITDKTPKEEIIAWLNKVALKHTKVETLITSIKLLEESAYACGKVDKANEIKQALYL